MFSFELVLIFSLPSGLGGGTGLGMGGAQLGDFIGPSTAKRFRSMGSKKRNRILQRFTGHF